MAKGNDGNYLQHSVEIALAWHLVTRTAGNGLHVALCHGMAPYEPCGPIPAGQTRTLLMEALERARKPRTDGELPIISAYRTTKASLERYPNTGELLAAIVGRDRLTGGITEVSEEKHAALRDAWAESSVTPVVGSWRGQVKVGGVLNCPASLESPWMFSADPMTYHDDGDFDNEQLYRADGDRLSDLLKRFIESGQPGAAALFVYAVRPDIRPKFWRFTDELAEQVGATNISCWLTHQGGNRNLAAILCSPSLIRPAWLPRSVNFGR